MHRPIPSWQINSDVQKGNPNNNLVLEVIFPAEPYEKLRNLSILKIANGVTNM